MNNKLSGIIMLLIFGTMVAMNFVNQLFSWALPYMKPIDWFGTIVMSILFLGGIYLIAQKEEWG